MDAWKRALEGTETWRQWSADDATFGAVHHEVMWQLALNAPSPEPSDASRLQDLQSMFAVSISANLLYHLHEGTVIEATPALEMLLTNSDVDLSTPMSMVAPPYAAQYVHFGDQAMAHLKAPNATLPGHVFDGAFCFFSPVSQRESQHRWAFELVFVTKRQDRFNGQVVIRGETDRGNASVADWLDGILDGQVGPALDDCRESMHAAVSYVVKLFLYLGLRQARRVERNEYDEALRRAQGLGNRKRAKVLRRASSLYNAIVVGPETMASPAAANAAGSGVAPHWRRGHFSNAGAWGGAAGAQVDIRGASADQC